MTEVKWALTPEDIQWNMDWSYVDDKGHRRYPDKPEIEEIFVPETALAHLLMNRVVFLNTHHLEKDWPVKAQQSLVLYVNCNDTFAWGCSDAEDVSFNELESLYKMWKDYPLGADLWCMIKRREMPQKEVELLIRKEGFDLDAFRSEHKLRDNFYEKMGNKILNLKYTAYSDWCRSLGEVPHPLAFGWWDRYAVFLKENLTWEKDVLLPAINQVRLDVQKEDGWKQEDFEG